MKVADMARDLIRLSGLIPDKDIEVQFTGMRPGEKLFEELVGAGEFAEPSQLDKILRVQTTAPRSRAGFAASVARLEALALEDCADDVRRELRTILSTCAPTRAETSPA